MLKLVKLVLYCMDRSIAPLTSIAVYKASLAWLDIKPSDELAIWLVGIAGVLLLVVIFGDVVLARTSVGRDDE